MDLHIYIFHKSITIAIYTLQYYEVDRYKSSTINVISYYFYFRPEKLLRLRTRFAGGSFQPMRGQLWPRSTNGNI